MLFATQFLYEIKANVGSKLIALQMEVVVLQGLGIGLLRFLSLQRLRSVVNYSGWWFADTRCRSCVWHDSYYFLNWEAAYSAIWKLLCAWEKYKASRVKGVCWSDNHLFNILFDSSPYRQHVCKGKAFHAKSLFVTSFFSFRPWKCGNQVRSQLPI